jgi:hypothetical protein
MSDLISPSDEGRVQAIRARLAKAEATIAMLNNGEGRWRMSIPARPDDDPDLIFAAVIRDASDLLRENDALREQLVAVREDLEQSVCDRLREEDEAAATEAALSTARAALAEAETRIKALHKLGETYKTYPEWKAAYEEWKAAGRVGGRFGRPVADTLGNCATCGKVTTEPELRPAFPQPGVWCECAVPPTHCCGARGFGLKAGDVCPACAASTRAASAPSGESQPNE